MTTASPQRAGGTTTQTPVLARPQYVGIHLSGPNSPRTTLVILKGNPLHSTLQVDQIYGHLGSLGGLFSGSMSDDRLLNILEHQKNVMRIMIDSPLSEPPCVRCTRSQCPGVKGCEDVDVAYMVALSEKYHASGKRKRRLLNPQSHRVWEVEHFLFHGESFQPLYQAHLHSLVTRAKVLQRRLNGVKASFPNLEETHLGLTLTALVTEFGFKADFALEMRSFERGLEARVVFIEELVKRGWLGRGGFEADFLASVENFSALMAAVVGALAGSSLARSPRVADTVDHVWIPEFKNRVNVSQTKR